MNRVIDACAMIAFLRNEPGAEFVEMILTHPTDGVTHMQSTFARYITTSSDTLAPERRAGRLMIWDELAFAPVVT